MNPWDAPDPVTLNSLPSAPKRVAAPGGEAEEGSGLEAEKSPEDAPGPMVQRLKDSGLFSAGTNRDIQIISDAPPPARGMRSPQSGGNGEPSGLSYSPPSLADGLQTTQFVQKNPPQAQDADGSSSPEAESVSDVQAIGPANDGVPPAQKDPESQFSLDVDEQLEPSNLMWIGVLAGLGATLVAFLVLFYVFGGFGSAATPAVSDEGVATEEKAPVPVQVEPKENDTTEGMEDGEALEASGAAVGEELIGADGEGSNEEAASGEEVLEGVDAPAGDGEGLDGQLPATGGAVEPMTESTPGEEAAAPVAPESAKAPELKQPTEAGSTPPKEETTPPAPEEN